MKYVLLVVVVCGLLKAIGLFDMIWAKIKEGVLAVKDWIIRKV